MRCWLWFGSLVFLYAVSGVFIAGRAQAQGGGPAVDGPHIQQVGLHNNVLIRAVGEPGRYTGFDVLADDTLVAPVRFTSHGLIFSVKAAATQSGLTSTLVFADLQAAPESGLKLEHSQITVTLYSQQYPTVAFDLHIAAFDAGQWQQSLGLQPFHFLTLGMPDATVWHQGGWLNATPRADLFPLLLDVPARAPAVSAPYNREWSRTPSLAVQPLPVIGLWSPTRKLYAAWDFLPARLEANLKDNATRDIATGFCNRLIVATDPTLPATLETVPAFTQAPDDHVPPSKNGRPPQKRDRRTSKLLTPDEQGQREYDQRGTGKFVALVSPPGRSDQSDQSNQSDRSDQQEIVYPAKDAHIASRATLVFSADLSDSDDPNCFLWQRWWNTAALRARLPHVPLVNDVGWISADQHLQQLSSVPVGDLIAGARSPFQIPGSLILSGWGWHNESAIDASARNDDRVRLAQLQADAQTLLKYARHFTADKEACVYWEKPLAGEWTPAWGGEAVTSLHNANGWAAGRLFLDLYRGERAKRAHAGRKEAVREDVSEQVKAETKEKTIRKTKSEISRCLQIVDGVFNWTKHMVWTRNEFADTPSSPSAAGSTLATAFLLDYYFTFKEGSENSNGSDASDTSVGSFDPRTARNGPASIASESSEARQGEYLEEQGERRTRALQALDMARAFTYRYMVLRVGAKDGHDNRHDAFWWEANAGQTTEVAGAGSGKAMTWNLDTLAQVAVHTGDPILLWALQGSLAHWPLYCQDAADNSLATGLDTGLSKEANANLTLSMIEPVGTTQVRILCGEKAALAFDRNRSDLLVTNYRCTHPGDFAFTLQRVDAAPPDTLRAANTPKNAARQTRTSDTIDATVTFPYADLSRKTVFVRKGNILQRTLRPGVELVRNPNALWSFIVRGLHVGDTLIVGSPDLHRADRLPSVPPLSEVMETDKADGQDTP